MNYGTSKTMREVVSHLRRTAAEAMLELFELHIAVNEVVLNFQVLSAVASELAAESNELAGTPELATAERLRELASAAAKTSDVVTGQCKAIAEIQRGIDGWNITRPGMRLV